MVKSVKKEARKSDAPLKKAAKNSETKKCPTCGYTKVWLHGGDCPLCKPCGRCGNRVRHCACLEGE